MIIFKLSTNIREVITHLEEKYDIKFTWVVGTYHNYITIHLVTGNMTQLHYSINYAKTMKLVNTANKQ